MPDSDVPVALEHLPDLAGMPVIWIYGPNGALISKSSGAKNDIIKAAIQAALDASVP